jgi:hypothetical protein
MADVQLSTLGAEIKTAYEGEADTNVFDDAAETKLAALSTTGYDADPTTDASASYELVPANAGGVHEQTSGSANGVVIPDSAVTPLPVNCRIDLLQSGAGLTTVTITTDTLNGEVVSTGQNKWMSLWQKSLGVWFIAGGTTA